MKLDARGQPFLLQPSDWLVPLLAATPSSLIVGYWFFTTLTVVAPDLWGILRVLFSIIAGIAFDVTVVKTTTGDLLPQGRLGGLARLTPFVAFLFASAIAYDLFSRGQWLPFDRSAFLHTGFAAVVWISGLYIAALIRQRYEQAHKYYDARDAELQRVANAEAAMHDAVVRSDELIADNKALRAEIAQLNIRVIEAEQIRSEIETRIARAKQEAQAHYQAEITRERERWVLDLEKVNLEYERLTKARDTALALPRTFRTPSQMSGENVIDLRPFLDIGERETMPTLRELFHRSPSITNEQISQITGWPLKKFNRQASRIRSELRQARILQEEST